MVVDGSEMVVVCKAVEVDPDLDSVALVQESCGKVLSGRSLTRLELDPRGLHGMQLGAEEWFRDTDLEDENASEQRLLQVHRLDLLLAPGVVRVVGVGSPSHNCLIYSFPSHGRLFGGRFGVDCHEAKRLHRNISFTFTDYAIIP